MIELALILWLLINQVRLTFLFTFCLVCLVLYSMNTRQKLFETFTTMKNGPFCDDQTGLKFMAFNKSSEAYLFVYFLFSLFTFIFTEHETKIV